VSAVCVSMRQLSSSAHLGPLHGPPSSRHKRARLWNYRAMTIASMYAEFAVREARGISPTYERLSLSVAGDEEILALLETVPAAKRQPNLLLGVVRFLGGPVDEPAAFHDFTVANWPAGVEGRLLLGHVQQVRKFGPGTADGSFEGQQGSRQPIIGSGRPRGLWLAGGPQVPAG
jgi:hypothetical protein